VLTASHPVRHRDIVAYIAVDLPICQKTPNKNIYSESAGGAELKYGGWLGKGRDAVHRALAGRR